MLKISIERVYNTADPTVEAAPVIPGVGDPFGPLQSSGPISLQDIGKQFVLPRDYDMSDFYGLDKNVPTSGELSISDFYGAQKIFVINLDFPDNQFDVTGRIIDGTTYSCKALNNFDLLNWAQGYGWNAFSELYILIPENRFYYATSTSSPLFVISSSRPSLGGSVPVNRPWPRLLQIDNQGISMGRGGTGASGSSNGVRGGDVFQITSNQDCAAINIFNTGYILAGGGGGGRSNRGGYNGGGGGGAGGGAGGQYLADGGAGGGPGQIGADGKTNTGGGGGGERGRGGYYGGGGGGYDANKGTDDYGGGGGGGRWPIVGQARASGGGGDNPGGQGGGYSTAGGDSTNAGGGGGWGSRGGQGAVTNTYGGAGRAIVQSLASGATKGADVQISNTPGVGVIEGDY